MEIGCTAKLLHTGTLNADTINAERYSKCRIQEGEDSKNFAVEHVIAEI